MSDTKPNQEKNRIKLILICGPWSSGTSAISGVMHELGFDGLPPYFGTNDARTKNSFESQAFRNVINAVASEDTLKLLVSRSEARINLQAFHDDLLNKNPTWQDSKLRPSLFLKYPLSAFLIPEICAVFDTRLIYVLRPLKDIENTRLRRNWHDNFGALGANKIYSFMFNFLINFSVPIFLVRYPELLRQPGVLIKALSSFIGVDPDHATLQKAIQFINPK